MIETRLWFRDDKVSTGLWGDTTTLSVDVRLEYVPRIGETVNYTSETGRPYERKVIDVAWFIAADGAQGVTLTLADEDDE